MTSFMQEDVEVARHSHLPPLQLNFPAQSIDATTRDALAACLEQKWNHEVHVAQKRKWIPDAEGLSALPAFKEAAADDAGHVRSMEEDAAKREEMRLKAEEEAKRVEEERIRRQEEAKLEEAKRRAEEKEKRRLERMLAKEERRAREKAEVQRRYDELHSRWHSTVEQRSMAVEEVRQQAAGAEERKERIERRLAELERRKEDLVKQLRDLATRPMAAQDTTTASAPKSEDRAPNKSESDRHHHHHRERARSPPQYSLYQPYASFHQTKGSYSDVAEAAAGLLSTHNRDGSLPNSPKAGRPGGDHPWQRAPPIRTSALENPKSSGGGGLGPGGQRDRHGFISGGGGGGSWEDGPSNIRNDRPASSGAAPQRGVGMRSHMGGRGGRGGGLYDDQDEFRGSRMPYRSSAWEHSRPGLDSGPPNRLQRDFRPREDLREREREGPSTDRPGGFARPLSFEEREKARQQGGVGGGGVGMRPGIRGPPEGIRGGQQRPWDGPPSFQQPPDRHHQGPGPRGWEQGSGWRGRGRGRR